ncbi:MAG TPA: hypothetical protein VJB41_02915 [Patescibacteria group bacterium]|nr:hypothetical protein [Patescibacteria group bacterium]
MGQIILGIVGIIVGTMMVAKSEWLLSAFGRVNWAEAHLGTEGGTRIFYKLLGLITIFVSLLIMTGMVEGVLMAIFSPLFPNQN